MELLPIIPTIIRLLVPFLIFRFALIGILLSNLADLYDWKFTDHSTFEKLTFYQNWDKTMDMYYLFFIALIVLKFKDKIAKNTALFLFFYRIIGVILLYMTHNRSFLFFFPNIFENFVLFYLFYNFLTKKTILFKNTKIFIIVMSIISIPKLIHEYTQHYLLHQPWEYIDIAGFLETTGIIQEYLNYFFYGGIFYIAPMGITLFFLKKGKIH